MCTLLIVALAALIGSIRAWGGLAAGYAVYSVRDNGTSRRLLATVPSTLFSPGTDVWLVTRSPSRDSFLVVRSDGLFIAGLDGSHSIALSPVGKRIANYTPAAFSHDGRLIAFSAFDPNCLWANCNDLYVTGADGTGLRLLASNAVDPSWSADGKWIAYLGDLDQNGGAGATYVVHPDGSGLRRIATAVGLYGPPSFAPSGTLLAYGCAAGLCLTELGTPQRRLLSRAQGSLWSLDGHKIALIQGSNGVNHSVLAVVDVATSRTRRLTTSDTNGTTDTPLAWSPDSSKLAFRRNCEYAPPDCRIAVYALNLANGTKHRLSRDAHRWMDVRWSKHTLSYVAATG